MTSRIAWLACAYSAWSYCSDSFGRACGTSCVFGRYLRSVLRAVGGTAPKPGPALPSAETRPRTLNDGLTDGYLAHAFLRFAPTASRISITREPNRAVADGTAGGISLRDISDRHRPASVLRTM